LAETRIGVAGTRRRREKRVDRKALPASKKKAHQGLQADRFEWRIRKGLERQRQGFDAVAVHQRGALGQPAALRPTACRALAPQ